MHSYRDAVSLGVIVPTKLCAPNATEAYVRYASTRGLAIDPDVQPRYRYTGGYEQARANDMINSGCKKSSPGLRFGLDFPLPDHLGACPCV